MRNFILIILFVSLISLQSCFRSKTTKQTDTNSTNSIISTDTSSELQTTAEKPIDTMVFYAASSNWDLVSDQEDYLDSQSYSLFYSGELQYYERYNKSGKKNEQELTISPEDLQTIQNLLEKSFRDESKNRDGADGTGWKMEYFNPDGDLIHDFHGYIYGSDKEKIIEILNTYIKR